MLLAVCFHYQVLAVRYKPTLTPTYLAWRLQALERLPRTQRCVWCLRVQARLPRPALRCVAPRLDALPRAALVLCLQALERLPRTPALRLVPAGASAPASASAACPRLGYGRRVWCLRVMARLLRPPAPRMVSARAGAPASTRAVVCRTALRRAAHARHHDHRRVGDEVWRPRVPARLPRPTHTPAVLLPNTPTPQCALGLRLC